MDWQSKRQRLMIDLLPIFCLMAFNCMWIVGFFVSCQYEVEAYTHINPDKGMIPIISYKVKEKMILWWVKWYTQDFLGWFKKPLYDCCACMASVHGILFMLVFLPHTIETLCLAPFYIGALAGLNQLVANKFEL